MPHSWTTVVLLPRKTSHVQPGQRRTHFMIHQHVARTTPRPKQSKPNPTKSNSVPQKQKPREGEGPIHKRYWEYNHNNDITIIVIIIHTLLSIGATLTLRSRFGFWGPMATTTLTLIGARTQPYNRTPSSENIN